MSMKLKAINSRMSLTPTIKVFHPKDVGVEGSAIGQWWQDTIRNALDKGLTFELVSKFPSWSRSHFFPMTCAQQLMELQELYNFQLLLTAELSEKLEKTESLERCWN